MKTSENALYEIRLKHFSLSLSLSLAHFRLSLVACLSHIGTLSISVPALSFCGLRSVSESEPAGQVTGQLFYQLFTDTEKKEGKRRDIHTERKRKHC